MDGSGAIDAPKELQQFVTQLLYGLEYPHQFNTIMNLEVEKISTEFSWSLTQFVQWFSERIRSCEAAEAPAPPMLADLQSDIDRVTSTFELVQLAKAAGVAITAINMPRL